MPDTLILDVDGDAHTRGREQGAVFGDAIRAHERALLEAWRRSGVDDPRAYRAKMLADTRFDEAIEHYVPHLMREVEGIAVGAGVACDDIYALQLLDEEWAYRSATKRAPKLEKCSSFAVHDGAREVTWIGQNMDLGAYTDGLQRVVRHHPDAGPAALLFTTAGVLGLMGVNAAGVGVCVNAIPQVPSAQQGIPVAFMVRRLLEARSAEEAAEWCRSLPHATNQHYVIADPDNIVSLEASSAGVAPYHAPDAGRVLHTNHPLQSGFPRYPEDDPNSVARRRSLEARLSEGQPDLAAFEGALSAFDDADHPVCRLRTDDLGIISFTTGSIIAALARPPATIDSRVSFGPPGERGYRTVALQG